MIATIKINELELERTWCPTK